jgi:hypothetical protein
MVPPVDIPPGFAFPPVALSPLPESEQPGKADNPLANTEKNNNERMDFITPPCWVDTDNG